MSQEVVPSTTLNGVMFFFIFTQPNASVTAQFLCEFLSAELYHCIVKKICRVLSATAAILNLTAVTLERYKKKS